MKLSPKKAELIGLAKKMLEGEIDLIEGVRRINALRFEVGEPDSEPFMAIRAVDSETDHFPLGSVRERYSPEALRRVDVEMENYLLEASEDIRRACDQIIRVFGSR
jgi:hypothetical protein